MYKYSVETCYRLPIWLFAQVVLLFPNWQLSQLHLSACGQPHFVSKAPFCGVRLLLEGEIHETGFLNIMRHSGRNPKPKHKPEITQVASSYPLVPFVINSTADHLSVTVEFFEQLSEQKIKCVVFWPHLTECSHFTAACVRSDHERSDFHYPLPQDLNVSVCVCGRCLFFMCPDSCQ